MYFNSLSEVAMLTRLSVLIFFLLVFSGCGQISTAGKEKENVSESFSDYQDDDNYVSDLLNNDAAEGESSDFDFFDYDTEYADENINEKPDEDGVYEKYKFQWTFVKEEKDLAHVFSRGAQNNAAIVFKNKFYILSGGNPSFILQSLNAVAWTVLSSENLPVFSGQGTVVVHRDMIFALTESGLFVSEDGIKWDLVDLPGGIGLRTGWSLTSWNDHLWIAGGYAENITANDLWYSGDGKTWMIHSVFENVKVSDKQYHSWDAENGLVGMSFFKTDDYMFLFGGHLEKKIDRYSIFPYGGGASFACSHRIFGYSDVSYRINKDSITETVEIVGDGLGITNAVAFRHADKNWITAGQIIKSDDYYEQRYTGGTTIAICSDNDPLSYFFMKKSKDLSNWDFDDTVLPETVEKLPVILNYNDKVWIFGAENSSEIWNGTEQFFTYDNEKDYVCSRGEYKLGMSVVIKNNEDVLKYKGFTKMPYLQITGEVDDLSPLFCLEEVESLEVQDTTMLKSLNGLTNIIRINHQMYFISTNLEKIEMINLGRIGEPAIISFNKLLKSIKINNLEKFPIELKISSNPMLEETDVCSSESDLSLDGVTIIDTPNLRKNDFTEKITNALNIRIENVPISSVMFPKLEYSEKIKLKEILEDKGDAVIFPKLKEAGDMTLVYLDPQVFPVLERINNDLEIYGNQLFKDSNNFPALTSVGGRIEFINFFESEISGFNSLKTVGGISFSQGMVERVSGFDSLTTIDSFSVSSNEFIKDFSGFIFLNRIQELSMKSIFIEGNKLLENIDALSIIRKISSIKILDNSSLVDISALKNCTSIGDDFQIFSRGAGVLPVSQAKLITDHFISLGANEESIFFSGCFENSSCE